jgi:ribonuclease HI
LPITRGTNNTAEVSAIGVVCDILLDMEVEPGRLVIFSDSDYAAKMLSTAHPATFRANDRLISTVIDKLCDLSTRLNSNIEICWVAGHSNCIGNNFVDALATRAALASRDTRGWDGISDYRPHIKFFNNLGISSDSGLEEIFNRLHSLPSEDLG